MCVERSAGADEDFPAGLMCLLVQEKGRKKAEEEVEVVIY